MRKNFLPFSRPSIGHREINEVVEVLKSGWLTTGTKCSQFESAISQYCGAQCSVALNSATAGLHLLLEALNIGPGDEVITPSMTWVSTPNMIEKMGARTVFCDVDPETLMTSADLIQPHITDRTKLIIPVHFAGAAVHMNPIRELCSQHGIFLAEDAAHAIGTEYAGEKIGKNGTTIFSFHPIKNVTSGEGGALCTDIPSLALSIKRLKFHGLEVDAFDRFTQGRSPQAEVVEPGFKYNLTDMAAALGLVQLQRLESFIEKRTELAKLYLQELQQVDEIRPLGLPTYEQRHAWHLFVIRLDLGKAGMDRATFMHKLKERNIGSGIHFRAVHLQEYYRHHYPDACRHLAHTNWNSERLCSLPLFPDMTPEDVGDVVAAIKAVLA